MFFIWELIRFLLKNTKYSPVIANHILYIDKINNGNLSYLFRNRLYFLLCSGYSGIVQIYVVTKLTKNKSIIYDEKYI